ncbi:MAG: choice-of-anchor B family protein [Bacteroidetes bacterium]|nr:choice-of-anchor B family protein [Bacteroidota bacterium]
MKRICLYIFLIVLIIIPFSITAQYDAQNVSLISHWYNPAQVGEKSYGVKYNSVFGWVHPVNNKEYAILGSGSGTHFIDLSNPSNPVERDFVAGRRDSCLWREYKTYQKYLYAVSDNKSPNSFQIIDMSYLPDSVHVVYDDTTIFERSHTIFIDGDKLYCGSNTLALGGGYHSMAVYSLANPQLPVLLRGLEQDYPNIGFAHDMFVRNDTVYASCGGQGLFIYKFNSNNTFSLINSLTAYPNQGYNHSSYLTPNGKTLVFCDEVPENLNVKILDVTDLKNMSIIKSFKSNEGATAHNPYVFETDRAVIAYYQDGLQIFDISNPALPIKTGYFDTDTLKGKNTNFDNNPTYHGCWGAYVDLPSHLILASDMQNGLYVLDASIALGLKEKISFSNSVNIYPNPTNSSISITINLKNTDAISIELLDITGRKIIEQWENIVPGNTIIPVNIQSLAAGIYVLKISGKEISYSQKIVRE